jgi:hypothetical protein
VALAFFTSLGMVAVVGAATAASFFVTCFAVCMGGLALSRDQKLSGIDSVAIFAVVISGIVALIVFVLLIRALARGKE